MSKPYVGITLDIIDYYPTDYDFSSFSFIFISESKDFEREISYINSNQICQKILINKKDIKYSIKVTKDDSFIGISEFIIPYQIIAKKENIYDKVCLITMTDSIKKILFGGKSNYTPLKIGIHTTLQYIGGESTIDANNKKEKLDIKQRKKKEEKTKPFTPKKLLNKDKTFRVINNSNSGLNNKLNSINLMNNSINKISKKEEPFFTHIKNNKTYRGHQRTCSSQRQTENSPKLKSMKNTFRGKYKEIKTENNENDTKKNLVKDLTYKEIKSIKDEKKETKEEKEENNTIEIKGYDEILDIKDDHSEEIIELKNDLKNYIEENINEKLNEIKDKNDMIKYTNNNLNNLLNYQMKYYELIQKEMELGNKYKKLLLEYNEKYRNNLIRINKLKDDNKYYEIKKDIILHNDNIHNEEIINMKNNELEIFNKIFSNMTIENQKNEENSRKNEQFLLLFKVLKKLNNKYGPIQNLLTQSNSTENQRINLRKIINKYNKELELNMNNNLKNSNTNNISDSNNNGNKELDNNTITNSNSKNNKNIDKFDFVLSSKPDDIDMKIELFLKQFYLKHNNIPKIIFKKTSKNNYEYGKQKIMIKLEGEAIRVRYSGGYILLDKFVELNANLEENKKKNLKSNGMNQSKNNIKKKNKK